MHINASSKITSKSETYKVRLPGGSFSVEIPRGAKTVLAKVSAPHWGYMRSERISDVQARYRFMRAAFGMLYEAGVLSTAQFAKALETCDRAAAPLLLS
jgi:hypothetical protein